MEDEYEDSELVAFGYNRDKKRGHEQIVISLLCASDGCPIAVDVLRGNTKDETTQHLSSVNTAIGNTVRQGQVIGRVGSTGISTGPHLHFELRSNGRHVDPLSYSPSLFRMPDFLDGFDFLDLIRRHWILLCVGMVVVAFLGRRIGQ